MAYQNCMHLFASFACKLTLCCCTFFYAMPICIAEYKSEQILFDRSSEATSTHYFYKWYDHNGKRRSIDFSINKKSVKDLPTSHVNYMPTLIRQKIKQDLLRLAKRINPKRARIRIEEIGSDIDIAIRSRDEVLINALYNEFEQQQALTLNQYFREHYFEYFSPATGEKGVKADHTRYIAEFTEVLQPAAAKFYESLGNTITVRAYLNIILSWAQSIPYNELTGRGAANGSGFSPPTALLDANLGDCDSKSVLVAALLRNFLPQSTFKLVLLPNHALLAINITKSESDYAIEHNGSSLVVIEPTGPAPLKLGELGENSRHFIERGLYTLQDIP